MTDEQVERVAQAIQAAEDSSLKIEVFYYTNHPGGPHVIRDFRTDRNGPVLWIGEDREDCNRELERLKLEHIARAAIAAMQDPELGWQPIETAPRANIVDGDGPRLLVCWEKYSGHVSIARHGRYPANDGITWFTDNGLPCGATPTHWRPLPAPPADPRKDAP